MPYLTQPCGQVAALYTIFPYDPSQQILQIVSSYTFNCRLNSSQVVPRYQVCHWHVGFPNTSKWTTPPVLYEDTYSDWLSTNSPVEPRFLTYLPQRQGLTIP